MSVIIIIIIMIAKLTARQLKMNTVLVVPKNWKNRFGSGGHVPDPIYPRQHEISKLWCPTLGISSRLERRFREI